MRGESDGVLASRTIKGSERFEIAPTENIWVSEPVGYFEMICLLSNFSAVITDSGGLQKGAFYLKNDV